ncbi:hypothetical protein WOLCODRAFT_114758 [Wolfiporia cocos MD-104 SS10]|uniref:Trs120-domain-containing protein n=1 Tax=Wolfiporia cocos (strain MD-104) TaxID=742152 RepID=A0A2H3JPW9_WOLCO|nr:hypothetical protein WOLCODRAFT_114758 [Wolfiporia cocos MD-104 SS10]
MDALAFGSLANIRIQLVPIGNIRKATYEKWVSEIRSFESIPLGDIPADTRDERGRFMPRPLASGHLHLSFPAHPPPTSHQPLSLFRPSDFPLGVIGIASCSRSDSVSSILAAFNASMSMFSAHGSTYPLASKCFVFEDGDANLDIGDRFPGLVVIPGMMGNKSVHIGTLLAGLCSQILGEFSTMMQALESPLGNEYLNAALFPTLPPASEMPRSLDSENGYRDSLPPLPSQHSQPDLNRAKSPLGTKRGSIGPGLMPIRHASLPVTPATATMKKRPNVIGAASSHGRLYKVLGDLFLLAGRHEDSLIWYTEAIALFKSPQDAAWHASALEGLATIPIVEAWSSNTTMAAPAGDKDPWYDIVDRLTQASALYYKATPPSDLESAYLLLAYLYSHSLLRHTSFLFAIWCSKGWGLLAFASMLHPGQNPYLPLASSTDTTTDSNGVTITMTSPRLKNSYADLERLTSITGISRVQIATILTQVHGPWLLHLGARERIAILQTVAGMYGALGYFRKEAYILRELLGSVMDLIVCGREEGSGARVTNAGLGIRGAATGPAGQGTVGVRENQRTEGNDSVLRIVKHVCRVHGVDLEAVKMFDLGAVADRTSKGQTLGNNDDAELDDDLVEGPQEPFGWPELQIGIVREAIAVAEALPDYPSVAQFSLSALKVLHPVMSQSDQFHLYHTATRALATAIRRGDRRTVEYWAGRPCISIEVLPLPLIRIPIEKPISLLASSDERAVNPILAGAKDPFLYNPRKLMSGQAQSILVQNEKFEVVVTLRNPFVFDLQLENLSLSTSGARVEVDAMSVIVPANTYHPVTMSGKAVEAGTLVIRGCIVQAPGGIPREYVVPLSTDEEEDKRVRRRSAADPESGRSKRTGLDSRPWKRDSKRLSNQNAASSTSTSTVRYLECKVVPEQPLLRIRRTSLTHGAVMLYDGETSSIRITLENVSSLPIDFMRLTFDDSTIAPAQQTLADGELPVFETYETEYDLIHRPVFTWDSTREAQRVDAGEKTSITVKCFGKVGCTSGTIHVSYAHINRHRDTLEEPSDVFHTRQLSYPVVVTVYHMLECDAMDILSYSSLVSFSAIANGDDDSPANKAMKALLSVGNAADWCLFSVDVRNTYGLPFDVTFERNQPGTEYASTSCLVPPGSTSRLIIPIKKMLLPEESTSKPIPTLSDRQFVVTKSNLTSAEEKAQRELFWYREELFKIVRGYWRESGGSRTGELSLRQQRMTLPMLEALRTETARVQMSLFCYDENQSEKAVPRDPSGTKFLPPPNEFMYLRTKIINLSPADLVLTLDLSLEPSQYVVYQGVLSDIPIGRLQPGESEEAELPVVFVSGGRFDFAAEVHVHRRRRDGSGLVGRGQLRAVF